MSYIKRQQFLYVEFTKYLETKVLINEGTTPFLHTITFSPLQSCSVFTHVRNLHGHMTKLYDKTIIEFVFRMITRVIKALDRVIYLCLRLQPIKQTPALTIFAIILNLTQ